MTPRPRRSRRETPADALARALLHLANEVDGLRAFEPEVRSAISNTNWACFRHAHDEARAALAAYEAAPKGVCFEEQRAAFRAFVKSRNYKLHSAFPWACWYAATVRAHGAEKMEDGDGD